MKDHVIALAEAVRLARLELNCYRDPRCAASPEWTLKRLEELLLDPSVGEAMLTVTPEADSPPLAPDHISETDAAPSMLTRRRAGSGAPARGSYAAAAGTPLRHR